MSPVGPRERTTVPHEGATTAVHRSSGNNSKDNGRQATIARFHGSNGHGPTSPVRASASSFLTVTPTSSPQRRPRPHPLSPLPLPLSASPSASQPRKKSGTVRNSWYRILLVCMGGGYWVVTILWTVHQQTAPLGPHQYDQRQEQMHHLQLQHPTIISNPSFEETTLQDTFHQHYEHRPHQGSVDPTAIEAAHLDGTATNTTKETVWGASHSLQYHANATKKKRPLDPFWWRHHVDKLARSWKHRSIHSWCREFDKFPPAPPVVLGHHQIARGMVYIKLYKASSSTCEGIARSIAHHVGTRQWLKHRKSKYFKHLNKINGTSIMCRAWTRHEFANNHMQARRHLNESMLWTFVRQPATRDLSHIYHFEVGRKQRNMTSEEIRNQIQQHLKGFQTRYLVPHKAQPTPLWPLHEIRKNRTKAVQIMRNQIFENFDFIGMTERMSESLACMVLLWKLKPQDVVVLNAKRSGGFDDGGGGNWCIKIPRPPPKDPVLEHYFTHRHPLWNADVLLYHAVNASLELTMDALGRDRVHKMAQYIEELQRIAQSHCEEQAYFPCSPEGVFQPQLAQQSCYVQDSGCGYECVQRVLSNVTLPGPEEDTDQQRKEEEPPPPSSTTTKT